MGDTDNQVGYREVYPDKGRRFKSVQAHFKEGNTLTDIEYDSKELSNFRDFELYEYPKKTEDSKKYNLSDYLTLKEKENDLEKFEIEMPANVNYLASISKGDNLEIYFELFKYDSEQRLHVVYYSHPVMKIPLKYKDALYKFLEKDFE